MPKRVIARKRQNGVKRFYADFRDFAPQGGTYEALKVSGERYATTDEDIAIELAARRLRELEDKRRRKVLLGVERVEGLKAFTAEHLLQKARAGKVTARWLEQTQKQLESAIDFFGADCDVASITTAGVRAYWEHLRVTSNGRGGTLSNGSQRHYLNSLSGLFRRAASEGLVLPGYNPVAALLDKPTGDAEEAKWLTAEEAALLLESARTCMPGPNFHAGPIYPLLATFLLTGGRTSEVLGLEVDDISFQRKTITFRPNEWRRLKTKTSHRSVKLWPQLEAILRAYLLEQERAGGLGRLLFPSPLSGPERLIKDFRKTLDAVAMRAGWQAGEVRSKAFRHTFTSQRLQTFSWVKTGEDDEGPVLSAIPITRFQVGKELGHGGTAMVDRVYAHLGEEQHRSEFVEYRIEHHKKALGDRLTALQCATP